MHKIANIPWVRFLSVASLVAAIWLVGFFLMCSPVGDPLLRLSYDYLHLFTNHHPDSRVMVIALNETTDRKLGRRQGTPFSRRFHAKLLNRLKQAGAERVCFDILFDLPSSDPAADEELVGAVKSHGHVILGATEEATRQDRAIHASTVIAPFPTLRSAAEGWGLLNVPTPDLDGVVRRFNTNQGIAPPLALVAAKAENQDQASPDATPLWLHYQALPGGITTLEFSDCLNPETVPDEMLRGKTIFIGGEYAADDYGRRDVFRTPYTRFGAPDIYGVAWHATAFLNARDNLWLTSAGQPRNALWCLPFALASLFIFGLGKKSALPMVWIVLIWALMALVYSATSIFLIWNDRALVNWIVPLLVQFPCCFVALFAHRFVRSKESLVRYLMTPQPRELENIVVFISFSSKDGALAAELQQFLTDNGYPAWFCKAHIESGGFWADSIAKAIEKCRVVLFIQSKHSLASHFCFDEITLAKDAKKLIIPLRMDNSPLEGRYKLHLGATQEIDACKLPLEKMLPHVIGAVSRAVAGKKSIS